MESAAGEQAVAHVCVELGEFKVLCKELAVDVGELVELLVEIVLAVPGVGVEHAKELFEADAKIGAILGGAVEEEQLKGLLREDAVVLGEETEEDADQEALEFVAGIAASFEGIVQVAHELSGFEIGGVFGIEPVLGVTGNEGEVVDVFVEIGERELDAGR
jgi:hypothetical protein